MPHRLPPITALPQGCAYHPRCDRATDRCRAEIPERDSSGAACFHPLKTAEAARRR